MSSNQLDASANPQYHGPSNDPIALLSGCGGARLFEDNGNLLGITTFTVGSKQNLYCESWRMASGGDCIFKSCLMDEAIPLYLTRLYIYD